MAFVFTAFHLRDRVTRTQIMLWHLHGLCVYGISFKGQSHKNTNHEVAYTWPLCLLHFIKGTESQEQKCVQWQIHGLCVYCICFKGKGQSKLQENMKDGCKIISTSVMPCKTISTTFYDGDNKITQFLQYIRLTFFLMATHIYILQQCGVWNFFFYRSEQFK